MLARAGKIRQERWLGAWAASENMFSNLRAPTGRGPQSVSLVQATLQDSAERHTPSSSHLLSLSMPPIHVDTGYPCDCGPHHETILRREHQHNLKTL